MFYKKELLKTNQNEFRVKRKAINYMLDGKVMIILLTVGLIKKRHDKWVNIFQNENV